MSEDFEYLWDQARSLPEDLAFLCVDVLLMTNFDTSYGSAGKHHAYPGGLVSHTAEVLRFALKTAESFPHANLDVIKTAVIYHDAMKVREYNPDEAGVGTYSDGEPVKFKKTEYRLKVRHVSGSHALFVRNEAFLDRSGKTPLLDDLKLKIEHCILAHHGRQEWGSPVEPQSLEAYIIHVADMLSCNYGETNGK